MAMHLVDGMSVGYVDVNTYIERTSQKFDVSPKTVRNKIWELQNYGWGSYEPEQNRFYYRGQDKLFEYVENPSSLAVYLGWKHINKLKTARAYFYQATLVTKKGEIHISRETIHNKTGHTRKTQRKYEEIVNIEKRYNYAALGEYEGPDQIRNLTYEECHNLFLGEFEGNTEVFRQIPNTYYHNLILGKRRIKPRKNGNWGNEYADQVFYDSNYNGQIPKTAFVHKANNIWYRQC